MGLGQLLWNIYLFSGKSKNRAWLADGDYRNNKMLTSLSFQFVIPSLETAPKCCRKSCILS